MMVQKILKLFYMWLNSRRQNDTRSNILYANSVPHSILFNMLINDRNRTKSMLITIAQTGKQV